MVSVDECLSLSSKHLDDYLALLSILGQVVSSCNVQLIFHKELILKADSNSVDLGMS